MIAYGQRKEGQEKEEEMRSFEREGEREKRAEGSVLCCHKHSHFRLLLSWLPISTHTMNAQIHTYHRMHTWSGLHSLSLPHTHTKKKEGTGRRNGDRRIYKGKGIWHTLREWEHRETINSHSSISPFVHHGTLLSAPSTLGQSENIKPGHTHTHIYKF